MSELHALEKEMATHSSVLAWRIPGTGDPGGLLSMGSHRVRQQQQKDIGKDSDAGRDWGQEEKGMTDEMARWHH